MKINAIDIKPGNVLEHQNKLWLVLKRELVQPGKGGAFAQVELRDLRGGSKLNERFRTQELLLRYLPAPPAVVLDVGGGTGQYATWLAALGYTVHLVDPGIDTGGVLYQARIVPAPEDDYATFSYLQVAAALPLIEKAAKDAIAGTLTVHQVDLPSRLWSHPTIWEYVAAGLRRGHACGPDGRAGAGAGDRRGHDAKARSGPHGGFLCGHRRVR